MSNHSFKADSWLTVKWEHLYACVCEGVFVSLNNKTLWVSLLPVIDFTLERN